MSVSTVDRSQWLKTGLRLQTASIAWIVVEAGVAIGAGVMAGSLLLVEFGVDSVIELISAAMLLWRLVSESTGRADFEAVERRASGIAGYLLYALSLYVLIQAGYGFTHRHHADTSWPGLVIAVLAAFGMPVLAKAKIRVADQISSGAMRADAMETFTCGYLAWVLLAGLVLNAALHWWWLDAAASLVIVPLLIKEGREAIKGECSCH
jgi:divalent metal cation (Fe/Co/Zn/Cd) transporter